MVRFALLFMLLANLTSGVSQPTNSEEELKRKANALAAKFIIVDGHVDLPYRLRIIKFRLEREYMSIPVQSDEGDFDFERARKGGLDAPFMSIYIPSALQKNPDKGKSLADSLINMVQGITRSLPDKFGMTLTPDQIEANTKAGKISLPMGT